MKRVVGIGGVFFRAKDPKALVQWYQKHLGIDFGQNTYMVFNLQEDSGEQNFSFFNENTEYFNPSEKQFMINFRVENLDELLTALKDEGVHVFSETESYDYGKFGWILDPEGNKIELWEPGEFPE